MRGRGFRYKFLAQENVKKKLKNVFIKWIEIEEIKKKKYDL